MNTYIILYWILCIIIGIICGTFIKDGFIAVIVALLVSLILGFGFIAFNLF